MTTMQADPFADQGAPDSGSATDFFSGGAPSCKFQAIGDMHHGTILKFEEAQQRDLKTQQPKTWPDGNPAMMLVITLQTNERDPQIEDDDGERRLYVNKPSGMFVAIKAALGKERICVGGKLAVKYVKNGTPTQAGFNAPKEYAAKYQPPGIGSANAEPPRQAKLAPAIERVENAPLADDDIPF